MPRRKKGAGLNEHVENYIEEESDFTPDENRLEKHRNRYYKAYAEANGIPLKVKKPSGSMFKKSKFVINPIIVNSFNKRVEQTKLRKKIEEEERSKRQEEIIRRNLEKDKMKQAKQKLLTRSGAFQENETNEDKKKASQNFVKMRKTLKKRGRSKLRKTRKNPDDLSTNALTPEERDKIVREQMLNADHSKMNQAAGKRKTRRKRGKGPAFSKTSGMVRRRMELRNAAMEKARKNFLKKYDEYMKEKGDKTGILPSAEQMNEWVKESRENVFHPNADDYTEKKYKGIKYTAQKGGKRRRKRKRRRTKKKCRIKKRKTKKRRR